MSDKLAKIIQSDPDMVRRASDIEVDEVTLTKKGALGDQADAVILFKEDAEEQPDGAVSDEATEEEVAVVEKEEPEVVAPKLDFESAVSFIRKSELTEEQRTSLVDMALELNQSADIEKTGNETGTAATIESVFPEEAMNLLKSMSESLSKLTAPPNPMYISTAKLTEDETLGTLGEPAEIVKSEETTEAKAPVSSLAESVGARLLKAQEERLAQGRAEQDASLLNAVGSLSASLEAVTQKLEASGKKLNRACGQDA